MNAGGGLGYSQTGYAAGISGGGVGLDTSAKAICEVATVSGALPAGATLYKLS